MREALDTVVDIDPTIFKANDIRGIVDQNLNEELAYLIGCGFASLAHSRGEQTVVVARDGRLSGPMLMKAFIQGVTDSGLNVVDIGMVPSPLCYFATHLLKTGTGVMLTGSHNPKDYNGFKMMMSGYSLTSEDIQYLYTIIKEERFISGQGAVIEKDIKQAYIQSVMNDVQLQKPMKVVIDCGNGVAGVCAEKLFQALGCTVIPMYCDVDGTFPNHHPDPSKVENLEDLITKVIAEKADCGLAFDGDGDRLGVVTNDGQIVWPDRQLMLFAENVLKSHPESAIIYDVKCTKSLHQHILQHAGKPVMHKTGHALIKQKMKMENAPLAGEMSGHFFFNDRWFGFDDGLYAGARLLEILSQAPVSVDDIFKSLPNTINTPEIQIAIDENEKFAFMDSLVNQKLFTEGNIITIDGLRVEFEHSWGLIRASNTSPYLVSRFEATTKKDLADIQALFKEKLLKIKPDLAIPF